MPSGQGEVPDKGQKKRGRAAFFEIRTRISKIL
jgi:hypothetical protein